MIPDFLSSSALIVWMTYTAIVSCLISVAAFFTHRSERRLNRPVRWIWIAAVSATMLFAIAAPFRVRSLPASPNRVSAVIDPAAYKGRESAADRRDWIYRLTSTVAAPLDFTMNRVERLVGERNPEMYRLVAIVWLAVSAIMTVVFVLAYARVTRRVRRSPSASIDGKAVRVSGSFGPAVVGLAPSEIVIPQWLLSRPLQEQAMAVTHEEEHIRAADPWVLALACAAVSSMPWNPALWYCFSKLRLAVEIDCDRRVIQRGIPAASYGSLLIDFSASYARSPLIVAAFPGTRTNLKRRLIAMTERPVRTAPARRIASLAIAAVIFIAACETRLPTSAEVENMNAASAVEYTKAAVPDTRSPQYVINGKVADKKSAETLRPEEIAAINVLKGTAGSPDQIRIATLSAAATVEPSILDKSGRSSTTASTIRLKGAGTPAGFDGLLIVDGEIVSASYLNSLSPDRIASMEVLKSAAATTQYNDARAANGVIRITTKR